MIKELCYEWVLFWTNFLSCKKAYGFFDNKNIYKKTSWLNWMKQPITL